MYRLYMLSLLIWTCILFALVCLIGSEFVCIWLQNYCSQYPERCLFAFDRSIKRTAWVISERWWCWPGCRACGATCQRSASASIKEVSRKCSIFPFLVFPSTIMRRMACRKESALLLPVNSVLLKLYFSGCYLYTFHVNHFPFSYFKNETWHFLLWHCKCCPYMFL